MIGQFTSHHWETKLENGTTIISGGTTYGEGFAISWQNGAIKETSEGVNGAFVETIIDAAKDRLASFQGTTAKCAENQEAIEHLELALAALDKRTQRRIEEGKEGTHNF